MAWPSCAAGARRPGPGPSPGSPIRPSGTTWGAPRLGLEGVDLFEDLLVGREAIGRLVVVDPLAVDVDEEHAAHAFLQLGDDPVLVLDGGLQTGGLRQVVSLAAVRDPDLHPIPLSVRAAPRRPSEPGRRGANAVMIRSPSGAVKPRGDATWPFPS